MKIKKTELKNIIENVIKEENNEKRYFAIIGYYIWENDDQSALQQAQSFAKEFDKIEDNRCSVLKLVEMPQGSMKSRVVFEDL